MLNKWCDRRNIHAPAIWSGNPTTTIRNTPRSLPLLILQRLRGWHGSALAVVLRGCGLEVIADSSSYCSGNPFHVVQASAVKSWVVFYVGLIWRTGREEVVVVASVHFEYCLCNELEKRIFQGLEMYLRFRLLQGKVLLSHMHSSCDDVVKVPSFMKQNSICTTTSVLFIALQDLICI